MALPTPLPFEVANFPKIPLAERSYHYWTMQHELIDFDFTYTGHTPPTSVSDVDGGKLVLGSGSASAEDFVQMQQIGSSVNLNRLNKTLQFLWSFQLDSATLTEALLGFVVTGTDLMHNNFTDGFGFYVNQKNGPATGAWTAFCARGSAAQFTGYSQINNVATADTNQHTFAVQIITDPVTLGCGNITWFVDGVQVANTSGSTTAFLPTANLLRNTIAMGNGSGVARTGTLYFDAWADQS